MATAYAPPMASQLLKSSSSLVCSKPRGLSGASLTRRPRFVVKAIKADKPNYQVVQPINGDPFIGSLETPVTSSPLVAWSHGSMELLASRCRNHWNNYYTSMRNRYGFFKNLAGILLVR